MDFLKEFKEPPRKYSVTPLWFLNGTLKKENLKQQMEEMVQKGVYGAFMHARAYLKTPYLEKEWWEAVKACVEKGKKIGFSTWIYDEYAWPSGTAGSTFEYGFQKPSRILNGKPENMAKGLYFKKIEIKHVSQISKAVKEDKDLQLFGIYLKEVQKDSYTMFESLKEIDEARLEKVVFNHTTVILCFIQIFTKAVDYLNKKTIKEFLNETHEKYKEQVGSEFKNTIPGIFFDEIYLESPEYAWTKELPTVFYKQLGYDLIENLPLLLEDNEKGKRLRLDYYKVLSNMYEEAFFKQISDWCTQNHLLLTGHTEEELASHAKRQGNYFQTMRHLQIPGSDCHDYRYQMPRKISIQEPKYAVSVARAYGKKRILSEAMGGAGWGCTLQEYRRGIHTLAAMGINFFCLHGLYYECEHQGSQADWPASFFYQNPYWKYFKVFADEIRRISFMNTIGRPAVENALFYPISDIQANTVDGKPNAACIAIEHAFHLVLKTMVEHQVDIDFIDEECLLTSDIKEGRLLSGGRKLKNLFINEDAFISQKLKEKLKAFERAGGMIYYYCWKEDSLHTKPENVYVQYIKTQEPDVKILEGEAEEIYVNHRTIENKDFYFITNSDDKEKEIKLSIRCLGKVRKLNPETGEEEFIQARTKGNKSILHLNLKQDEAFYILFEPDETKPQKVSLEAKGYHIVTGNWDILPLNEEYDLKWGIDVSESKIAIPVAVFASQLHQESIPIRIQNTAWEKGSLKRHLSLWNGAWITRRQYWNDCMMLKDLYFRKRIQLPSMPDKAVVCVAAVNEFTLYVNGIYVIKQVSQFKPVIIPIAQYMKAGDNLFAIHVHNETPFKSPNFAEEENVPKDRMISLLFEGEFQCGLKKISLSSDSTWIVSGTEMYDWMKPKEQYEEDAIIYDASKYIPPAKGTQWLYAWERGKLPLLPWGDMNLFGRELRYPLKVHYTIILPCGTASIIKPEVEGEAVYTIDGNDVTCKMNCGEFFCEPINRVRILQIHLTANQDQGLKAPVEVIIKPYKGGYGEWGKYGMPWFSGRVWYKNTIELSKLEKKQNARYRICLGKVYHFAEIWINGKLAGVRLWEPYELDITDYLKTGENEIIIIVANLAASKQRHMLVDEGKAVAWNRYWNEDNIDRESEKLISGLMGPVRIYLYLEK